MTTAGPPIQPFKPDVQHLVPDTGDRATVSCDSVIGIVTLQFGRAGGAVGREVDAGSPGTTA
jgi:hypothetical protein